MVNPPSPPRPHVVLVVDDNQDLADSLVDLLQGNGYDASTAYTATEAIGHVGTRSFDAIITDIHMPGMNGIQLIRHLRQYASRQPAVLIALTGVAEISDRVAAAAGFDAVLQKPVAFAQLLRVLRTQLDRSSDDSRPLA